MKTLVISHVLNSYLQIYDSFSLFCPLVGEKRGEFRF